MDLGICGRTALVTGASRGLGFACARALAQEGADLILVARSAAPLARAASSLSAESGVKIACVAADVATEAGRAQILAAGPPPDILINNAGGPRNGDFRGLTPADWAHALDTNFLAAVELIRATADGMAARGFGRIVNITSMSVRMPVAQLELSNAARLALTGYVASVSRQIAASGVTLNNLLPGTISTERIAELGDTARDLIAKVPAGRAGTPQEFGAVCAFLCSEQAAYITGQNILVDGGLCAFAV